VDNTLENAYYFAEVARSWFDAVLVFSIVLKGENGVGI
jgi:hypothetical protein